MKQLSRNAVSLLCVCFLGLGLFSAFSQSNQPPTQPVLTNAAQIRVLSQELAAQKLPVLLRGVVLGEANPTRYEFAIQDETAGVEIRGIPSQFGQIRLGDLVEVSGFTGSGGFAPHVGVRSVIKLGSGKASPPRLVTYQEIIAGGLNAQWIEVSGVVRYLEPHSKAKKCRLDLATGGGRIFVRMMSQPGQDLQVDAEVRIRGVCYYQFNAQRQVINPLIAVPPEVPVLVTVPAPQTRFQSPPQAIGSLFQASPDASFSHRVHVQGVLTHRLPREAFWITDETNGLQVLTLQPGTALNIGDVVDVVGFPKLGNYSPMLEDAEFQIITSGPPPRPKRLSAPSDALGQDCKLIELEGILTKLYTDRDNLTLLVSHNANVFTPTMKLTKGHSAPKDWLVGSRIRVAGICSVIPDYSKTRLFSGLQQAIGFQLLIRSPADVTIIKPPDWWTPERRIRLLVIVAIALLLTVATVIQIARQRLKEQTAKRALAEAEFSAILSERHRVAREIHDILSQGLSVICLHLDLVRDQIKDLPQHTGRHIEIAHDLSRSSMADARDAVWKMRSHALEKSDLATALEAVLKQVTEATGITPQFERAGQPRRLSPTSENAILRIGQEAITNAVRHAHPTNVALRLEFANDAVSLTIRDNGCGSSADKPANGAKGFGMVGMRERAEQLGGEITFSFQPGKGTHIHLFVPTSPQQSLP